MRRRSTASTDAPLTVPSVAVSRGLACALLLLAPSGCATGRTARIEALAGASGASAASSAASYPSSSVDRAPEIQAALDAAGAAGGGVVRLGAGLFPLRRALSVPSRVTLRGAGSGRTTLLLVALDTRLP